MQCFRWSLALTLLVGAAVSAQAANWPRFRGPNGTGVAADKDIPIKWTENEGILWKTELPGLGNGSPIVWGENVFLESASADGKERYLVCLSASEGKVLWKRSVPASNTKRHAQNSLASSTPATDGERVYALFWVGTNIQLHAFDFKGTPLWNRDLGPFKSQHGVGGSPIVHDGKVFFANDQDGTAALLAFDAATGKPLWQAERKPYRACYSTPFLQTGADGKVELIVSSTAGATAYDPNTGKVAWDWEWPWPTDRPLRTVGSHLAVGGQLILTSGDGSGERNMVALRMGEKPEVLWQTKETYTPYVPSVLALGDHVYTLNDKTGFATCMELRTGRVVWQERLGGAMSASPVLIDGKIYAINQAGDVFVFAAEPRFKLLARNKLGETVFASPAVANGKLLIRGDKHLFCIGHASAK